MKILKPDICLIGAGSGGLSVAAGAVQMGASVVLIEKSKMGGDCLNYGCVPSKALLAAAKTIKTIKHAQALGISCDEVNIDFEKVHAHVHDTIARIEPNDSVERFEKLGVTVIQDHAKFTNPKEVKTSEYTIKPRRFVIATGSTPRTPDIEGLNDLFFLTNETIFDLDTKPKHLIIIGGGPIGCEMAQAHRLLGCEVTMIIRHELLPRDDRDLINIIRDQFKEDGINIIEYATPTRIESHNSNVFVEYEQNTNETFKVEGSHLLVATGRTPTTDDLGLEHANVRFSDQGIDVDERLRTSNKKIFAIGDVTGLYQFTHMANYHAGIVIKNILFRLPAKVNFATKTWVTYTEPELAHVGITPQEATLFNGDIKVYSSPYKDNDRAQTERNVNGLIKVFTQKNGLILGVSIVGHGAGELLMPWSIAIKNKLKIGAIADQIVPYPTYSEINKRVAGQYYTPFLFSAKVRKIVKFLSKLG